MSTALTKASTRPDDRYVALPFYLLCDVSGSMSPHIGALNQALRDFRDSLASNPVLGDKVQLGVIDFADDAREVVPLGDFSGADLESRPLSARGGTNYGAALRTLRTTIERDVAAGSERYRYFRPAVFFLTDGVPTDHGWQTAFAELTSFDEERGEGFRSYPLFVPFGIGDADAKVLASMVHPQDRSVLFMANAGTTPAAAITKMTEAMLKSVLKSGNSVLRGTPMHVLPTQAELGPGVTAYPGGDFVN
jgi:uncharacterized protein YegL